MKILIIEDEFRNFNRLQKLLLEYDCTLEIEGPLESVVEARQWLHIHQGNQAPDIIFSDVRLSDGIAFDALSEMSSATSLVFTTAYDEYALQAFRYNGLAYLMKPVDAEELRAVMERIRQMRLPNEGLQMLMQQMKAHQMKYRERFLVAYKDGFLVVNVCDISHICTENKDTRIYLKNGKWYSISQPLEEVERELCPDDFFRVSRQYILHIDAIGGLKTHFVGKYRVVLKYYPETDVMCSRDRAPQLKEWLGK
jgi:DNA-binding LytR/AlgR family response regulator